jgi:glycosyltransferase involved in cell wall biosynthesis
MKIMFFSALYAPRMHGGAEKIVQILAEQMQAAGHTAVVVTTSPEHGTTVGHVNGVKVYYIGIRNLYWPYDGKKRASVARLLWHMIDRNNWLMMRAVRRVMEAERPTIVNSHSLTGLSTAVWRLASRLRVPVVHTLHDYSLLCPKASMYNRQENCARQCRACKAITLPGRAASGLVGHVIGVSAFTLERHLGAGYFRDATHEVIYNGIPMQSSHLATPVPDVAGRPLRMGFVGRLAPTKGLESLIDTLLALGRRDWTLAIAGRGEKQYEAALKRRYESSQVRFLGFVDPGELYAGIDLLAVPSLWEEPLATVILEAYSYGVPVLTARRGGLPELVEHERTGLVYAPETPGSLAGAVARLLDHPALLPPMRLAARQRAKLYQTDRFKTEYGRAFQAVAAAAYETIDAALAPTGK